MKLHTRDTRHRGFRRATTLMAACALLAAAACSDNISVHGNLPKERDINEIAIGLDDRSSVADRLGTPSTVSTFEDDKWYYIGSKMEKVAFMKPQVIDRKVLVVSFDDAGSVSDKSLYTLEDGRVIDLVDRETPTEGRELTILQQFFGNLGRFSSQSEGSQ
ncbi:MAG: outer membrane protein assembly factor BamE [Rhodovibrionaceae bacterium]|nr:outer membrane protein assembly factor BamE [Rhodovibrionaceae bacterium]